MQSTENIRARGQQRAELNRRVLELQARLVKQHGFDEYRVGEWLNAQTARHVRMGFASDEWTITLSDYPEKGYGGVARLQLAHRGTIRLDARAYARNQQTLPTVEELAALVCQ